MADDFGMELIDGRDALGIILFRDEGDQIATELKSIKLPKLELAKLCMQLGRALKAQHDAEVAASTEPTERCPKCGGPGGVHDPACVVHPMDHQPSDSGDDRG